MSIFKTILLFFLAFSNYTLAQHYGQNKMQGEIQELYFADLSNYIQVKIKSDHAKDYDFRLNPKDFNHLPSLSVGDKVKIEFSNKNHKKNARTIKPEYFKIENLKVKNTQYTKYQISSIHEIKNGIQLNLIKKGLNLKSFRAQFIGDAHRLIQSLNIKEKGVISLDLPDIQRKNVLTYLNAERVGKYFTSNVIKKEKKTMNQIFRGRISDLYFYRIRKKNKDRISFNLKLKDKLINFSLSNLESENKLKQIIPLYNGMELEILVKAHNNYKDVEELKVFRLDTNEYDLRLIKKSSTSKYIDDHINNNLKGVVKYIKFNENYVYISIRNKDLLSNERRNFKIYGSKKINILKKINLKKGDYIEFGIPDLMTDKIYYFPYSLEIREHISK